MESNWTPFGGWEGRPNGKLYPSCRETGCQFRAGVWTTSSGNDSGHRNGLKIPLRFTRAPLWRNDGSFLVESLQTIETEKVLYEICSPICLGHCSKARRREPCYSKRAMMAPIPTKLLQFGILTVLAKRQRSANCIFSCKLGSSKGFRRVTGESLVNQTASRSGLLQLSGWE